MPEETYSPPDAANILAGNGGDNTPTPEPPAGGAQPTSTGPDWDKFATTISGSIVEGLKPSVSARPEPEHKMTPEEARKALNVWEPGDDWYAQYDNLDQRKQAIAAMRDGMFKQNATYVQALVEHRLKEALAEITGKYDPIAERFSASEARAQEERLHTTYPALKDPALLPIVQAVGQHLIANGLVNGKTEPEAFKLLGAGVEAVIKKHNPAFTLSGAPSGSPAKTKTNGTNPNAIRATSPGGGGGGGNGAASPSTGNRALDIMKGLVEK